MTFFLLISVFLVIATAYTPNEWEDIVKRIKE